MKLSVIIPCYNEKSTIHTIIENVKKSPVRYKEIIVVDDLSTDGTRDLLKNELENEVDSVLYHSKNQGRIARLYFWDA